MLLAHHGTNTYLLISDPDEYLVFPRPTTIQDMLAPGGCLHPQSTFQAIFKIFDAFMVDEANQTLPELQRWLVEGNNAHPLRHYQYVSRTQHLHKVCENHFCYLMSMLWDTQCLNHADHVTSYEIHEGWQVETGGMSVELEPACGMILHLTYGVKLLFWGVCYRQPLRNAVYEPQHIKIHTEQIRSGCVALLVGRCVLFTQAHLHRMYDRSTDWLWPLNGMIDVPL